MYWYAASIKERMMTASRWPSTPVPVADDKIRSAFNAGKFFEKSVTGEITTTLTYDSHAEPPLATEPGCTRSQICEYWLDGTIVALVHQYLRPDGSIGASGRPDPKVLVLDDGTTVRTRAKEP